MGLVAHRFYLRYKKRRRRIVSLVLINPCFELTQDKLPQNLELEISFPSLIIRNNDVGQIAKLSMSACSGFGASRICGFSV